MLIDASCGRYKEVEAIAGELAHHQAFFRHTKEVFVTQFVKEVRRQGRVPGIKIKVVLPLVAQIYRVLTDFDNPAPEAALRNLEKLKTLEIEPDLLIQRLLTILVMRFIDDYRNDPLLMRRLALLSRYFDAVVSCLHERLETEVDGTLHQMPLRTEEIEALFADNKRVKLFNHYKGIPIRYEGLVTHDKRGGVILLVPKEKGIAAEWEGRLLMYESETDLKAVSMRVRRVGFLEKGATIHVDAFQWVDNYVNRRKSIRVLVEKPIKAKIVALNKQIELDVVDLSSRGLCLEGSTVSGLPINEYVEVELPIPGDEGEMRRIHMRGALRYISKPDSLHRRYHIVLQNDPQKEQVIAAFVAQEELRLLRQMRELAEEKN
jgi:hypothetical protein